MEMTIHFRPDLPAIEIIHNRENTECKEYVCLTLVDKCIAPKVDNRIVMFFKNPDQLRDFMVRLDFAYVEMMGDIEKMIGQPSGEEKKERV